MCVQCRITRGTDNGVHAPELFGQIRPSHTFHIKDSDVTVGMATLIAVRPWRDENDDLEGRLFGRDWCGEDAFNNLAVATKRAIASYSAVALYFCV